MATTDKKAEKAPKAEPVAMQSGETSGPIGEDVVIDALGLDPPMSAPSPKSAKTSTPPPAAEADSPAPVAVEATPAHHTRCTVVGTDVVSMGRLFHPGDVADFPNSDVASLPECLIPVS
jgi:hypothetical protein